MAQGVVRIKDLFALVYFRNFPFGGGGGGGTVSIWRRQTKPTEEDELGKGSGLFLFLSPPRQLGMSNPRGEIDLVQCKITTETNGESFPVASTSERRGWFGGGPVVMMVAFLVVVTQWLLLPGCPSCPFCLFNKTGSEFGFFI